jgi:histidinol-phosphate phosphatase family protein
MNDPRRAVFLDRDGTLIEDRHYIARPEDVHLLPDVADALNTLRNAGWRLVVITNQSGIARGLLSETDFARVQERIESLLADQGARLDATYHCPHHPDYSGPCECRKPGRLLYAQAARELGLDLDASAYVGDRWRDVEPALHLGGRGMLVPSSNTPPEDLQRAQRDAEIAASLNDVARRLSRPNER